MPSIEPQRLAALEAKLGMPLPGNFVAMLNSRPSSARLAIVAPGRLWRICTLFALDGGKDYNQLDELFRLVGDAVPRGTLPFAADPADNFFLLILKGRRTGEVVYWDHERGRGDDAVEPVASSLEEFCERLIPYTEELGDEFERQQEHAACHAPEVDPELAHLTAYLQRLPGFVQLIQAKRATDGNWSLKFKLDTAHPLAWHVVQSLGFVANLSRQLRQPAQFIPVSRAPYEFGGPERELKWILQSKKANCAPAWFQELLTGHLPQPVEVAERWQFVADDEEDE